MELMKLLKKSSATFLLILAIDSCIAAVTGKGIENILLYTAVLFFLLPVADILSSHKIIGKEKSGGFLSRKMRIYILSVTVGFSLVTTSYFFWKK